LDFVKKHNIVTLKVDFTEDSKVGDRWLDKLKSNGIPLTAIFPANRPEQPIIIRDVYTKTALLQNLRKAIALKPAKEPAVARSD
jgi:thiol:disulfide interchange protein